MAQPAPSAARGRMEDGAAQARREFVETIGSLEIYESLLGEDQALALVRRRKIGMEIPPQRREVQGSLAALCLPALEVGQSLRIQITGALAGRGSERHHYHGNRDDSEPHQQRDSLFCDRHGPEHDFLPYNLEACWPPFHPGSGCTRPISRKTTNERLNRDGGSPRADRSLARYGVERGSL